MHAIAPNPTVLASAAQFSMLDIGVRHAVHTPEAQHAAAVSRRGLNIG
jgi:hypothetical protein